MPRRMAYYDYADPELASEALPVALSALGALLLLTSAALFLLVLARNHRGSRSAPVEYRFSVAVNPPTSIPVALNGFALWLALMVGLTIVNYGPPIVQLWAFEGVAVPAVYEGTER
jgi:cytochrome c oxidase subunit I